MGIDLKIKENKISSTERILTLYHKAKNRIKIYLIMINENGLEIKRVK